VKQYQVLALYNDPTEMLKWLEEEKKNASKIIEEEGELSSWYWLTLEYDFDWEGSDKVSQVRWQIVQYLPEEGEYFCHRFSGGEYWYVKYVDGMFDAFTINYLDSRTRAGVYEV
jgi:hypothetical protein